MTRGVVSYRHECGAVVLKGDCECGIDSRADVAGLSVAGLAVALLTRRRVFDLVRDRGAWVIRGQVAEVTLARLGGVRPPCLTLGEHACRVPLPGDGRSALDVIAPRDDRDPLDALADVLGLPRPSRPPPF